MFTDLLADAVSGAERGNHRDQISNESQRCQDLQAFMSFEVLSLNIPLFFITLNIFLVMKSKAAWITTHVEN